MTLTETGEFVANMEHSNHVVVTDVVVVLSLHSFAIAILGGLIFLLRVVWIHSITSCLSTLGMAASVLLMAWTQRGRSLSKKAIRLPLAI